MSIFSDDTYLDALGGRDGSLIGMLMGDALSATLSDWREEVDARPVGSLVDIDTAVEAIMRERFKHGVRFKSAFGTWVDGELHAVLPGGMVEIRQPGSRSILIEFLADVRPVGE